jgi:hypothetical protein
MRPCSQADVGHLRALLMSSELPRSNPFALHSVVLATTQSGAPFGATTHRSDPATTFESGRRATVPAASVTPLARSPAALVAPPSVSPAPLTPAPTLVIDWSMKRPIAPITSGGVGRPGGWACGGGLGAASCAGAEAAARSTNVRPSTTRVGRVSCMLTTIDQLRREPPHGCARGVAKMRTPACGNFTT